MSIEGASPSPTGRVIVVGNEKGGSGKSTVAMHVAIALMKSNERVATIDLNSRQRTFTNYIENRYDRAQHITRNLEIPHHLYFVENTNYPTAEDEAADGKALTDHVVALARNYNFIVIDTPGRNSSLGRLAHSIADILITPLNDSFVDLDVLGTVDRPTIGVTGTSHYGQMVQDARLQRYRRDDVSIDWFVLRNRLSTLDSHNTRCVGEGLRELSRRLNFHCVAGLSERVIFREFYPRGLTALDDLDELILGTRPTMSHMSARLEIATLLSTMRLRGLALVGAMAGRARDAA